MSLSFSQVVGHERVITTLQAALRSDTVAHAYLFAGPDGVGKVRVAHSFFAALLCKAPEQALACGQCSGCRKLERGAHPDLLVVEREVSAKGARSRFIKIDQVRAISKVVHFEPIEARHRCVLIQDAHTLHEAAGNALLKVLEEPSSRTVFVLVTSAPQMLLGTIVSRCQRVRFHGLDRDAISSLLVREHGVSAEAADVAAALSGGSVSAALERLDESLVERRRDWLERLGGLGRMDDDEILSLAEFMGAERGRFEELLELTRFWVRDLTLLASGVESQGLINSDYDELLRHRAASCDRRALLLAHDRLEEVVRSQRVNVNARLASERLLFCLHAAGA